MKKLLYLPICAWVVLCLDSCSNGPRIKEKPDNIIETSPRTELYQAIMGEFPENKNNRIKQQVLFDASSEKRVILTRESEVYVTFISEGAGYENTFGWYIYDSTAVPSGPSKVDLNVLFPTVSDRILKQGDMLQIGSGTFPAGTVIGFFLIIKGWENGSVHFDRETFYTDYAWDPNGEQQHILYKQKDLGDLVLAFEDQNTSNASDNDFNDIIFTVTDNKSGEAATNFDLRKVVLE
jgi:hypothetical protein